VNPRLRVAKAACLGCLGIGLIGSAPACSDSATGKSTQISVTSTETAGSQPPVAPRALPGESVEDAYDRLLDLCMDAYGEKDYISSPDKPNQRAYNDGKPSTQKHHEECQAKAKTGLPTTSSAATEASYGVAVKFVECMRTAGFDMGQTVSFEEFRVAQGDVVLSANWTAASGSPRFGESMAKCDLASRPGGN
jgi:hypothetical protein